jgi:alpha-tubulin suppressor-like RCC1 family protein
MFGWGNNDYGQLGLGTEQRFVKEPKIIDTANKVRIFIVTNYIFENLF